MESFGLLLKRTRTRAGLTQRELAESVGLNHSYISKIERDVYAPPTRNKVLGLADALAITDKAERALFLLEAGCASAGDLRGVDEESLESVFPFSAEAFHFPATERLEEESLIKHIIQLLRNPDFSHEQRAEYIKLLISFVTWLEFKETGDARSNQNEK